MQNRFIIASALYLPHVVTCKSFMVETFPGLGAWEV